MGPIFAAFLFQLSFSTTATTIVSGAMAERCNFKAYCIFSFLNTAVYCIPAGWCVHFWSSTIVRLSMKISLSGFGGNTDSYTTWALWILQEVAPSI